jgi:hypothetical protein
MVTSSVFISYTLFLSYKKKVKTERKFLVVVTLHDVLELQQLATLQRFGMPFCKRCGAEDALTSVLT